ncbi:hypothetical protein [Clostridium paridis]|uniref:Uncharacterized protein n=1 Tax=Clostridium paridis TaxID=2803863 RepID=A0A937FJE7_9CLOT|nr:hypothetical protein [Clostridium paridis]MBL4932881.1 hypothetical protein [Clostridium paridis]
MKKQQNNTGIKGDVMNDGLNSDVGYKAGNFTKDAVKAFEQNVAKNTPKGDRFR